MPDEIGPGTPPPPKKPRKPRAKKAPGTPPPLAPWPGKVAGPELDWYKERPQRDPIDVALEDAEEWSRLRYTESDACSLIEALAAHLGDLRVECEKLRERIEELTPAK